MYKKLGGVEYLEKYCKGIKETPIQSQVSLAKVLYFGFPERVFRVIVKCFDGTFSNPKQFFSMALWLFFKRFRRFSIRIQSRIGRPIHYTTCMIHPAWTTVQTVTYICHGLRCPNCDSLYITTSNMEGKSG